MRWARRTSGLVLQATFDDLGLATCDGQELYIADLPACCDASISTPGTVSTVAGDASAANHCSELDRAGSAARFFFPTWWL